MVINEIHLMKFYNSVISIFYKISIYILILYKFFKVVVRYHNCYWISLSIDGSMFIHYCILHSICESWGAILFVNKCQAVDWNKLPSVTDVSGITCALANGQKYT